MRAIVVTLSLIFAVSASAQERRTAVKSDRPVAAAGYDVGVYARGVGVIEAMAVHAESGDILSVDSARGRVLRLRDRNGDGISEIKSTYLSGFDRPSGIAIFGKTVFISDAGGIWSAALTPGLTARAPATRLADLTKVKTAPMPRPITVIDDGKALLVGLGAMSARKDEPLPAASLIKVDTQTGRAMLFASGLRRVTALRMTAGGKVAALVSEAAPAPDYFALINEGEFYGWPYGYGAQVPVPGQTRKDPYKIAAMRPPLFDLQAGRAGTGVILPGDLGDAVPADLQGKMMLIKGERSLSVSAFDFGAAMLSFDDAEQVTLLSGFATERGAAWGQPSALAVDTSGGILVADRWSETIWRITQASPEPEAPENTEPDLAQADDKDGREETDAEKVGGKKSDDAADETDKPLTFRTQNGRTRPQKQGQ